MWKQTQKIKENEETEKMSQTEQDKNLKKGPE